MKRIRRTKAGLYVDTTKAGKVLTSAPLEYEWERFKKHMLEHNKDRDLRCCHFRPVIKINLWTPRW